MINRAEAPFKAACRSRSVGLQIRPTCTSPDIAQHCERRLHRERIEMSTKFNIFMHSNGKDALHLPHYLQHSSAFREEPLTRRVCAEK